MRLRCTLLLVSTLVMTLLVALPALAGGTFTDDDGSPHEGYIEAIASDGITAGCNPPANDRYCPDDAVTRGQMAAFLVRALGFGASGEDAFVDDDGSIFEADIQALAAAGVTKGCNPPTNDRFCPGAEVTRAQMASFLGRGLGLQPITPSGGDDGGGGGGATTGARTLDCFQYRSAGYCGGPFGPGGDRTVTCEHFTSAGDGAFTRLCRGDADRDGSVFGWQCKQRSNVALDCVTDVDDDRVADSEWRCERSVGVWDCTGQPNPYQGATSWTCEISRGKGWSCSGEVDGASAGREGIDCTYRRLSPDDQDWECSTTDSWAAHLLGGGMVLMVEYG